MTNWNKQSKNTANWTDQLKNTSTFSNGAGYLLQENGDYLLAEDETYINIGLYTEYTDWTKQTKN
jgi:hypothetical protein